MDKDNRYSLGLYEKALPKGLPFDRMLHMTKQFGFDRLELSIDESDARLARLEWTAAQCSEIRAMMAQENVPIRTLCLSAHRRYPMGSLCAATRLRAMDIMKKAIDLSAALGISVIQLAGYDVFYEEDSEETRDYFCENLAIAVQQAAAAGVVLAFETMETPFMDTVAKAMQYVRAINSPWLGIYPDIGNLQNAAVRYGSDFCNDLMTGGGHIFALHLKETRPGVYRNMRFGTGHTPYKDALSCAAKMGVRMFTGEFWHQPDENFTSVIPNAAAFLREKLDTAFV